MNYFVKIIISFVSVIAIFLCSTVVYVSAKEVETNINEDYLNIGILDISTYEKKIVGTEKYESLGDLSFLNQDGQTLHKIAHPNCYGDSTFVTPDLERHCEHYVKIKERKNFFSFAHTSRDGSLVIYLLYSDEETVTIRPENSLLTLLYPDANSITVSNSSWQYGSTYSGVNALQLDSSISKLVLLHGNYVDENGNKIYINNSSVFDSSNIVPINDYIKQKEEKYINYPSLPSTFELNFSSVHEFHDKIHNPAITAAFNELHGCSVSGCYFKKDFLSSSTSIFASKERDYKNFISKANYSIVSKYINTTGLKNNLIYYSSKPFLIKDGKYYLQANSVVYEIFGTGENYTINRVPIGQEDYQMFSTLNKKDLIILYSRSSNGNTSDPPIIDGNGEEVLFPTDNFRLQKKVEKYSDYDYNNYPVAPKITKFNGFFYDTKKVVNMNSEYYKTGGLKLENPSDFTAITWDGRGAIGGSTDSQNAFILNMGYNAYHFYLYNDTTKSWDKKSVWSSRPLKFVPAEQKGNTVIPPKLYFQKGSYGLVIEYGDTSIMSCYHATNNSLRPLEKDVLLTNQNFYIVNDDLSVSKDPNKEGTGSNITDGDGNITDTDGKPTDPNTGNDDFEWGLPDAPTADEGIFSWLKYIGDSITYTLQSIGNFFTNLVQGIGSIAEKSTGFLNFLAQTFSFLPAEVWTIIIVGLVGVVLLRFLGR